MTAGVAVLNCQAVGLAADSAVTINYPDGQKIFQPLGKQAFYAFEIRARGNYEVRSWRSHERTMGNNN